MKALFISADGFDDAELLVPYYRLQEEGIEVDIASREKKDPIIGKHGYKMAVTKTLAVVRAADYDLLVLPGGDAPETVRKEPEALEIAREFLMKSKPIAAICHGPQTLITTGLLKGKHATCARSVVDELLSAGAIYMDKEVVVDGNLVTSRRPSDLPAFMREIMKMIRNHAVQPKAA